MHSDFIYLPINTPNPANSAYIAATAEDLFPVNVTVKTIRGVSGLRGTTTSESILWLPNNGKLIQSSWGVFGLNI